MIAKRYILIYDRNPNEHVPRWLRNFVLYLQNKGYVVEVAGGEYHGDIQKYSHIFMWNGNLPIHVPIKAAAAAFEIPITIVEVGWFPQTAFYTLDSHGINAKSSLMTDTLEWVTDNHIKSFCRFKESYLNGLEWKPPGRYILCPLQLEFDTNIIEHSPYKTMQDFIDAVELRFPNDTIVFKTHPVSPNQAYKTKHDIVRCGDFNRLAANAKLVYGINSTCLLQSTMMGVPTEAIGDGFLSAHKDHPQKLLAAMVDKQIPIFETNLDRWVDNFLNGMKNETNQR